MADPTNIISIRPSDPRSGLNNVLDQMSLFRAALTCAAEVLYSEVESETGVRATMLLKRPVEEFDALYNQLDQAIIDAKPSGMVSRG